jgi:hypothetical protein
VVLLTGANFLEIVPDYSGKLAFGAQRQAAVDEKGISGQGLVAIKFSDERC